MAEPDWKEIALNIQRNTRETCEAECRRRVAPLIEANAELIVALKGLEYRDEPGRFCDHAAAPCNRCDTARAALNLAGEGT